jgi:tRNA(Ile)-lysidine synthase
MGTRREQELGNRLLEAWPPVDWRDSHVVLAVSAGPDSVALLRSMMAAKETVQGQGRLVVAHFHHGIRGALADADQAWLQELCSRVDLPLICGRPSDEAISDDQGDGWEAAARAARYRFLCETAEKMGARFVAVAHTADDQVETVLHRILRGTGLEGLGGIPRHRPLSPSVTLVRPLLNVKRMEILRYLSDVGQDFRIDETNADTQWTRNRLRHELLPMLRERYNRGVDDALLRLAVQAGETHQLIENLAQKLADECVSRDIAIAEGSIPTISRVRIDCGRLASASPAIVSEVCRIAWQQAKWPLQAMGYDEWQKLTDLVRGQSDEPLNLPGRIRAGRESEAVVLDSLG